MIKHSEYLVMLLADGTITVIRFHLNLMIARITIPTIKLCLCSSSTATLKCISASGSIDSYDMERVVFKDPLREGEAYLADSPFIPLPTTSLLSLEYCRELYIICYNSHRITKNYYQLIVLPDGTTYCCMYGVEELCVTYPLLKYQGVSFCHGGHLLATSFIKH